MLKHLTVVFLCALIGCDADGSDGMSSSEDTARTLRVGTYNAGLARGYVDHAELRLPRQLEALSGLSDLDLICLQEVWEPEDREMMIETLQDSFPYHHFQDTTNATLFPDADMSAAACSEEESQPLADCARPLCDGDPDIATCVLSNCGELFDALSAACQECAASNIGLGSVDAIIEACVFSGAAGYSYNGQNGLLLLSSAPITEPRFEQFDSFLISRGVLLATTHGVEVGCTHLTANMPEPVYSGEYGSYEEENADQIEALLALFPDADDAAPQVLVGDFNTEPQRGERDGEFTANFPLFAADGWQNANTSSEQPQCTWCDDNLITMDGRDFVIDHVFVRGADSDDPRRFLSDPVEVTSSDGEMFQTSYSDHFGLSVRLTIE